MSACCNPFVGKRDTDIKEFERASGKNIMKRDRRRAESCRKQ